VVVSAAAGTGIATALPNEEASRLAWHELECGGYEADLALWRKLAGPRPQRVLEVGAGAGRVSLDLARAGHVVTALDHDRALLSAIERRRGEAAVQTAHSDARSFSLRGPKFGLCVVPMHTIQLLRDSEERGAFLRCARQHLRRGGLLACAILTAVEPFDCRDGGLGPEADSANANGLLYISRPVRVEVCHEKIVIERERRILRLPKDSGGGRAVYEKQMVELVRERNQALLAQLGCAQLEREGQACGFRVEPASAIGRTDEHVGSAVVMLRA
jgi:SAM-dependent methyltransferase